MSIEQHSVISLKNLTKTYGKSRGVTGINLEVPRGTVFGFLGPNGAGKSTTINMLLNFIKPTSGKIHIFGKDSSKHGLEIRNEIGFLASDMALDSNLTGWQQLEYHGKLRGDYNKTYVTDLAKRLNCDLSKKIKNLSRGNHQKVALISAFMHKPKLLILDEPTSGLDPLMQLEFNKLILEHKAAGRSTFMSSHVLSEVQELCDHVAFIREGRLIANTTMSELTSTSPKEVYIACKDKTLVTRIKRLSGVESLKTKGNRITFTYTGTANDLTHVLGMHNIENLTIEDADLEALFMKYYENDSGEL